ncbi:MAG TPA: tetratricopeptide repeat protein [Blastocatellia bacterium]|nr:tetratricopeptide repeat protein [Blastocatellia bacterium]
MKISKIVRRLNAVLAVLLLAGVSGLVSASESNGKKIVFTTKSKEAHEQVVQAIRAIESFNAQQGLVHARKAVEADPNFAFAHYLLGVFQPPPQAKPHFDKATELAKSASEGERRYLEAIFLNRAQKPSEALAIFKELSQQYPEDRMVRMMIGQLSVILKDLNSAQAAFEKAAQLDASTPRVHTFLGNVYLLKGDYGKAREYYNASLAKKADGVAPFGAYNGLAYSYVYQGDVKSAIKTLEAFQVEYEKSPGAQNFPPVFIWNAIGRLLLENGKPEESIKAYEKGYATVAASSMPEQEKKIWLGRLHHGKGRALAKMGKHDEAWKEAELIKKMIDEGGEAGKPFMPAYHYIAGYLKLENGDSAAAVEHLKQADLNDPFHKLLLARAYDKAGDKASAQKVYKEIVDSTDITLERALSYPEAKKKLKG